ncbi:MAG TPA: HAMP domain-containing sensor histidine kinase [Ilumatobacter sp.]|nr:HAMP domain-containing sensor histidine kinase [Ilumatobacter sp.]
MTIATAEVLAVPGTRRQWGLRRRILLIFTLGALMLSLFLAVVTYGFSRASVVQQRETTARDIAAGNAAVVAEALRNNPSNAQLALDRLSDRGVLRPLVWYNGIPWRLDPAYDFPQLPPGLESRVINDLRAAMMIGRVGDELTLAVGFPLNNNSAYFEFFSLEEVNNALQSVQLSLILGTMITTALGVLAGTFAARRAVRPLGVAATAAKAIAGGRLDTRLEPTDDPDLSVLANSFNDMAAALQTRIERDTRFASDVSHELRSPLMTLSASVEVMDARRDEMPERAQAALDLLKSDVTRFKGLVEDLLEISRFDAGAVRLHKEELLAAEFVRQAVAVSSMPGTPIAVSPRAETVLITGDRRRLARVVANLIDNARLHGGGQPEVSIAEVDPEDAPITLIRIAVEDHGAGVPVEERELIFERFARGGVAGRRAGNDGAGLGLSLVDEHVRMHEGRVWVQDRLDGEPGARFVIELDAEELEDE